MSERDGGTLPGKPVLPNVRGANAATTGAAVVDFVSFPREVSIPIGTQHYSSIESYSRVKHGGEIRVEVVGDWLHFYSLLNPGKRHRLHAQGCVVTETLT